MKNNRKDEETVSFASVEVVPSAIENVFLVDIGLEGLVASYNSSVAADPKTLTRASLVSVKNIIITTI